MTLKQCVRAYMEAQDCEVKCKDLNTTVREIEEEIAGAKRTGDISKVELRWTKLYETFFVGHLPLEALDPFLDHLSNIFPAIKAKFELGDKIAAMFLNLPMNVPAIFPKQLIKTSAPRKQRAIVRPLRK